MPCVKVPLLISGLLHRELLTVKIRMETRHTCTSIDGKIDSLLPGLVPQQQLQPSHTQAVDVWQPTRRSEIYLLIYFVYLFGFCY